MRQFRENLHTDGKMNGRTDTIFFRTIMVAASSPHPPVNFREDLIKKLNLGGGGWGGAKFKGGRGYELPMMPWLLC